MFGIVSSLVSSEPDTSRHREVPPPTPVTFPSCIPKPPENVPLSDDQPPLVDILRRIQRPADIKVDYLEALGLHVIPDSPLKDIIPDESYLPPGSWTFIPADQIESINPLTVRPLNNDRDSPGVKVYQERIRELSIPNDAAFRTIRRQPAPHGQQNPRLGNAYEFYKYLELLSGFWIDASSPPPASTDPEAMDVDSAPVPETSQLNSYQHLIGTGSQTPPEFRNSLLAALTKYIAYDFGCNVTLPRIEPRLYISTPTCTSSFPSNVTFIYRTPTNRASARSGIVEGPVAALSARHVTGFKTPHDSLFDLCREVISVLVTAQQRSRENKSEKKAREDLWWCHKPRWGGGPGGPIGREADKVDETGATDTTAEGNLAGDIPGSLPVRKPRKKMSLYDNYRNVRPPSSTWDRKTKYLAIGKPAGAGFDDIFLLSCLNHHVSIVRVRVPTKLLEALEGARERPMEKCTMWRSRWYDMFLIDERIEAMTAIWGMMAYAMRKVDGTAGSGVGEPGERMKRA